MVDCMLQYTMLWVSSCFKLVSDMVLYFQATTQLARETEKALGLG